MSMRSSGGFTIIELMLFVAISAAIMVSLMVGWSMAINTQSYKDSARSLAQVLQQQYTGAVNVSNDRDSKVSCKLNGTSVVIEDGGSGATPIGASRCVLMGRYIIIDGSNLRMSNIIGYQVDTSSLTSDTQVINAYHPTKEDSSVIPDDTYSISWSTRPYIGNNTAKVAIVIVRSPLTGTIYTYAKQISNADTPPSVATMVVAANQQNMKLCLDPQAPVAQGRMAVQIAKNATSVAGVAVLGDAGAGC